MASPHRRKVQALTFQKDSPVTSEMDIRILTIQTIQIMSQVRGCANASGEQFPMPVNGIKAPTTVAIDPSSIDSLICVLSPSIHTHGMVAQLCCCGPRDGNLKDIEALRTPAQKRLKLLVGIVRVAEPLRLYSIEILGLFGLRGSDSLKIFRKTPGQVLLIRKDDYNPMPLDSRWHKPIMGNYNINTFLRTSAGNDRINSAIQ